MANILALTKGQPQRSLVSGETLIAAGDPGGELFVLESGRLRVSRDGVQIATISEPGALIGEMSVLLGDEHSASVTAEVATIVRVIEEALPFLERTPLMALHVATLACRRLEKTSALAVQLAREAEGKSAEQGFLSRLFGALTAPDGKGRPGEQH